MTGAALWSTLANAGLLSFLALSTWLLLRCGEISFGQQALFGIGAYAAGLCSAGLQWPWWSALPAGMAAGLGMAALAGSLLSHLRGLPFSIATLAAAEALRTGLAMLDLRWTTADGSVTGPQGSAGFGGIRGWLEGGGSEAGFVGLLATLLALLLLALRRLERSRWGRAVRMVGQDAGLAASTGVHVAAVRRGVFMLAGAVAGLGGALYAHHTTYIEPANFDLMLGVHALAYPLIGGPASPLGAFVGVAVDVGLLEGSRVFGAYRMIVFGGLVAVLLAWRPNGLLDEPMLQRLQAAARRLHRARHERPRGLGESA